MKKNLFLVLLLAFLVSGCDMFEKENVVDSENSEVAGIVDEMQYVNEDMIEAQSNSVAYINGVKVDENYVNEMMDEMADLPSYGSDLPAGFPVSQLPIIDSAKITLGETYGNGGFIVEFTVDKSMEFVNSFYASELRVEPLSSSDTEIYYEEVELNAGAVLKGLTIESTGANSSKVYMTVFDK